MRADAGRRAGRRRWSTTSPASGCTCGTCRTPCRTPAPSPTSTTTCAPPCGARPSCCSRPIVREDRSVLDLLGARYTFVNERLARHYGLRGIYGSRFRRIALAADSVRGGLLGQASIQTGHVVPQPDVAGAARQVAARERPRGPRRRTRRRTCRPSRRRLADGQPRSMREAMVQHRANPACASCHQVLDPLGFGMEHFDAVGAWRDTDGPNRAHRRDRQRCRAAPASTGPASCARRSCAGPSRSSASWPSGSSPTRSGAGWSPTTCPRSGPWRARPPRSDDYRFSALVMGIVESVPFQLRRTPS